MMKPAFTTFPQMRRPFACLACSRNPVMLGSAMKLPSAVVAPVISFTASCLVGSLAVARAVLNRSAHRASPTRMFFMGFPSRPRNLSNCVDGLTTIVRPLAARRALCLPERLFDVRDQRIGTRIVALTLDDDVDRRKRLAVKGRVEIGRRSDGGSRDVDASIDSRASGEAD